MQPIAVIAGDGVGREVIPAALGVIRSLTLGLEFDLLDDVCAERYRRAGISLTDAEFERAAQATAILFGAIGDPSVRSPDYPRGVLLRLRSELDLYINQRPVELLADRLSPLRDPRRRNIDCVVIRENTEGLYAGIGGTLRKGSAEEIAIDGEINTCTGVTRIIAHAFSIARQHVCVVDKSNAVRFGGQLWQRCWKEAGRQYANIRQSHLYIDAAVMKLVTDPDDFEVIVASNSHGDILSDLTAQLAGGIGCVPSANLNPLTRRALFEPVHGSAPDIAGRNEANPAGTILSVAMMLDFLGFSAESKAIRAAVRRAVRKRHCTRDLGGDLGTIEAAEAVRKEIDGK